MDLHLLTSSLYRIVLCISSWLAHHRSRHEGSFSLLQHPYDLVNHRSPRCQCRLALSKHSAIYTDERAAQPCFRLRQPDRQCWRLHVFRSRYNSHFLSGIGHQLSHHQILRQGQTGLKFREGAANTRQESRTIADWESWSSSTQELIALDRDRPPFLLDIHRGDVYICLTFAEVADEGSSVALQESCWTKALKDREGGEGVTTPDIPRWYYSVESIDLDTSWRSLYK